MTCPALLFWQLRHLALLALRALAVVSHKSATTLRVHFELHLLTTADFLEGLPGIVVERYLGANLFEDGLMLRLFRRFWAGVP